MQEAENEEEKSFLEKSDELGAEFVRLVLGDLDGRGRSMGPGRGSDAESTREEVGGATQRQQPEQAAGDSSASQDKGIKKFGEMLRNHGDEIDGDPNLERAVVSIAAKLLENTSVLQVSQAMFDGLCDKVLNSIAPRDGGQQTAAVFRVSTELIRSLRSQASFPMIRENTLIRYAGKYLVAVGLWVDLNTVLQQAASGVVPESALTFSSVDIPKEDS